MNATITARGKVKPMGRSQFNVLEEDVNRYLAEYKEAGCDTRADWAGKKPLLVTISRKEWVSQLHPGDEVEYVLRPVERNDKKSPTGKKVGTEGVSMTILSRADR
jgi:hypothetical protein